jgi:hypothetical protein
VEHDVVVALPLSISHHACLLQLQQLVDYFHMAIFTKVKLPDFLYQSHLFPLR